MDIDYICSLNRLRDKKEKRNGIDVVTEEGIIDTMIRESFLLKECEKGLGIYSTFDRQFYYGSYMCYKINSDDILDKYFITCADAYKKGWIRPHADIRDKISEGIKLGIENLIMLAEGKFNKKLLKDFNFEIDTIDDFKYMLKNDDLRKRILAYLITLVKYRPSELSYKGLHEEYLAKRKFINGKNTCQYESIDTISIQKTFDDDEENSEHTILKFLGVLDEDKFERDEIESIYKYINENRDKILTKEQNEFFSDFLRDEKEAKKKHGEINSYYYKVNIRKRIENYLDKNKFFKKTVYGYENKKFLIEILEDILNQESHIEGFKKLCYYLDHVSSKAVNVIEDIVFNLEPIYYKSVVKYINTQELDEDIEEKYNVIYDVLKKEYNFQATIPMRIYEYNASEKEKLDRKVIDYIERILQGEEKRLVLKGNGDMLKIRDVIKAVGDIYNKKIRFVDLCEILERLNFEVKRTTITIEGKRKSAYNIIRKNIPS